MASINGFAVRHFCHQASLDDDDDDDNDDDDDDIPALPSQNVWEATLTSYLEARCSLSLYTTLYPVHYL